MTNGAAVRCLGVSQVYDVDGEQVHALVDVDLEVTAGETVALFGPSGSGKSTLLALLAGLRRPTTGQVLLDDIDVTALSERALLRLRGEQIGVVVQNPSRSLLPYGTAEDNIRFAQRAADRTRRRALPAPRELLDRLGLGELAGQQTARLSGGEQQRLSVAVAMAGLPRVLLADEPTSQLDGENRDRVVELMQRVAQEFGTTLVVVTHDPVVADAMDRTVSLSEGRVVSDARGANHGHSALPTASSPAVVSDARGANHGHSALPTASSPAVVSDAGTASVGARRAEPR